MIQVTQERYDVLKDVLKPEELKSYEVEKVLTIQEYKDLLLKKDEHISNLNKESQTHREAKESEIKAKDELSIKEQEALKESGKYKELYDIQSKELELTNTKLNDANSKYETINTQYEDSSNQLNSLKESSLSKITDETMRATFQDSSLDVINAFLGTQNVVTDSVASNDANRQTNDVGVWDNVSISR